MGGERGEEGIVVVIEKSVEYKYVLFSLYFYLKSFLSRHPLPLTLGRFCMGNNYNIGIYKYDIRI